MARPSWLIDGSRFATKIKSASGTYNLGEVNWKSNPTRSCPRCLHTIDNSDVALAWPGLPRGVKFDPTDQEIIQHLLAKSGAIEEVPHPFIDEFIPTVEKEEGICYTHPRNLPGVKKDGNASHFFHRAIKAYNTGTRKRRKIQGGESIDVRWHKTGRTKPVILNGVHKGCKKIMVLYESSKGGKPEKTSWVMHQYHLGIEEEEKDGEFVISKVFYQQQQMKQSDKKAEDIFDMIDDAFVKVDPVTPKSVTPEPPRNERRFDPQEEEVHPCSNSIAEDHDFGFADEVRQPEASKSNSDSDNIASENLAVHIINNEENQQIIIDDDNLWDGGSQFIVDSQQLVEGLSLCDDLFQSQSPNRDGNSDLTVVKKSVLSEYVRLGPDDLKKDLEECQNLVIDPSNIELDTPPDFRLSQLEFGSQDSFLAFGGSKVGD